MSSMRLIFSSKPRNIRNWTCSWLSSQKHTSALSNEAISAAMSHIMFNVASSCICKPVSMLRRRMTFRCAQRFCIVSWLNSEKTCTTNRSGGQEAGCGTSWADMGELSSASKGIKDTTRSNYSTGEMLFSAARSASQYSEGLAPFVNKKRREYMADGHSRDMRQRLFKRRFTFVRYPSVVVLIVAVVRLRN